MYSLHRVMHLVVPRNACQPQRANRGHLALRGEKAPGALRAFFQRRARATARCYWRVSFASDGIVVDSSQGKKIDQQRLSEAYHKDDNDN